ncbi:MAG TPA: HD domain-containing phosphohydrolase [Candidatus Eisenbacteria bacterium]|nr:HD domain-containing phosphohydrolase [Candidatus Eisenbacteria bacterium]
MKSLHIERVGSRDRFRFRLEGIIDPAGARSLDRLLFECQARGARAVQLDFQKVTSICTLGTAVLARQGKVYEETERTIQVTGLAPQIRIALVEAEAVVYESNAPEAPAGADGPDVPAGAGTAEVPAGAGTAEAPVDPAPVSPAPSESSGRGAAGAEAEIAALQSKLKRKLVEFRNLFEITRALNLALDLDETLNLFSLSVMGQFGVERLAVFLPENRRPEILVPRQVRGFAQEHFKEFTIPASRFAAVSPDDTFVTLADLREAEGGESLEALRASGFEWIVLLRVRRDLEGLVFLGGRGSRRGFQEDERDLLSTLSNQAAVAIANARHHRAVEDRNLGLVRGMMSLVESRDVYARGTTERVVRYVSATAKLLHVPKASLKSLIYGAVLRDIGMITVSHLILKNPAHLSDDEWALIKQHPVRGAKIVEEMDLPKEVVDVVRHHHERWGGEGYPSGLRGTEIPLGARIVSLVDSYVAMTADRPYRRALPFDKARQVIAENWGTPFDPSVVDAFLEVLDKIERRSRQRQSGVVPSSPSPAAPPEERDTLPPDEAVPLESHP